MKFRDKRRILIFGRPGAGKTTLLVLEMIEALHKGDTVVSNVDIKWFGSLKVHTPFSLKVNALYSWFFSLSFLREKRDNKLNNLLERQQELKKLKKGVKYNRLKIPDVNLTAIHKELWNIKNEVYDIKFKNHNIRYGILKEHYYPPKNYYFEEDLKSAVNKILDLQEKDQEAHFMLALDEGFADLDHGRNVPPYITNFFNQSRKINVDVLVATQRPVAVYPSFRALVDFMVLVDKKMFNRFSSRKHFVDTSADALPTLGGHTPNGFFDETEKKDDSKPYKSWKGKDVYPFFNTRQSIALKKLIDYERQDI